MKDEQKINQRAQRLLMLLVDQYIQDGQPIGSHRLAKVSALSLSSATIRNIMMDLELLGYIQAPHTSAGRVPTDSGYRFFVDNLMLGPSPESQRQLKISLSNNPEGMINEVSEMVSNLTKLTCIVTMPKQGRLILRHVEFLPLNDHQVLVILVINNNEVQNRIVQVDAKYTRSELEVAANYLTQRYRGQELSTIREKLLADMRADQENMQWAAEAVINLAEQTCNKDKKEDFVISGESNLIDIAQESGLAKLRELFDAFTRKREILHLLDQSTHADGIQIFIGGESGIVEMDQCSFVMAPYKMSNEVVGVMGVIGPTRMFYDKVISTVDMTAKLLSEALADKGDNYYAN